MSKRPFRNWKEEFRRWDALKQLPMVTLRSLQVHQEKTSLALTDLQKANYDLQATLKEIEDKNLCSEAYSRQENIMFENILQATDKEDTESVLHAFFEMELGYKDAYTVEIQRFHRIGNKRFL